MQILRRTCFVVSLVASLPLLLSNSAAFAQGPKPKTPALVIINEPFPPSLKKKTDKVENTSSTETAVTHEDKTGVAPAIARTTPAPSRPLVKIRFDKADVDYATPVYMAMKEVLQKSPESRFEVVAIYPSAGQDIPTEVKAKVAHSNAEDVMQTLTKMGLPKDKMTLSSQPGPDAKTSEVHIFIR